MITPENQKDQYNNSKLVQDMINFNKGEIQMLYDI